MIAGQREYLGDGCYAEVEGADIVLTTGNGLVTTNRIVLEPEVLRAFADYVARLTRGSLDAVDEAEQSERADEALERFGDEPEGKSTES